MKKSQSPVFCSEKFCKFYRTLFRNRLYPQLLKSSIKFIELFFFIVWIILFIPNNKLTSSHTVFL